VANFGLEKDQTSKNISKLKNQTSSQVINMQYLIISEVISSNNLISSPRSGQNTQNTQNTLNALKNVISPRIPELLSIQHTLWKLDTLTFTMRMFNSGYLLNTLLNDLRGQLDTKSGYFAQFLSTIDSTANIPLKEYTFFGHVFNGIGIDQDHCGNGIKNDEKNVKFLNSFPWSFNEPITKHNESFFVMGCFELAVIVKALFQDSQPRRDCVNEMMDLYFNCFSLDLLEFGDENYQNLENFENVENFETKNGPHSSFTTTLPNISAKNQSNQANNNLDDECWDDFGVEKPPQHLSQKKHQQIEKNQPKSISLPSFNALPSMPMFNNLPIKVATVSGNRVGENVGSVRNITEKNDGDDFIWDENNNDKKNPQTVLIPPPNQQNIQPSNQKDDDFDWGW
jgi:hypothetical protein